ncbi:hypothetical protein LCGC14_1997210, partial [marine sediment metagenome]
GLFIQKTRKGYRQVHPAAWNGKIIWKNFLFGPGFLKGLLWLGIILFLVWSYNHDVQAYQDFYETVNSDPVLYCMNVSLVGLNQPEVIDENTYIIQNNNG